jgi:hypothetical protein
MRSKTRRPVELPNALVDELERVAQQRGMPITSLAAAWLWDRVRAEGEAIPLPEHAIRHAHLAGSGVNPPKPG